MPIIFNESHDPYFNLTAEELLFRKDYYGEDIFFIWESQPAFIIGRNQNPFCEINPDFFLKQIPIIRRISGGGTIYQDLGTLNFTFITSNFESKINDYQYFLEPIIKTLKDLGVDVSFVPKSHLFIGKTKISGNAQAFASNRLLHHGTLLFNTDLKIIEQALVRYKSNIETKQVLSNKQQVINLRTLIPESISYSDFKKLITQSYIDTRGISSRFVELTEEQITKIKTLAKEKYQSWEWNFGKTIDFDLPIMIKDKEVRLSVNKGIITTVDNPVANSFLGMKLYSEEYFNLNKKLCNF
jgi:lipoate---protein ligase